MKHSLETGYAVALFACIPTFAFAQAPAAQKPLPSSAHQIAAAVQPAPAELRDGAAVLGYNDARKLVPLREGKNDMVCLADDPSDERFHVACYHKALEPFMARGRSLRAEGVKGAQVDTARFKEIKSGKLAMPSTPSALYSLTGGTFDPATSKVTGAQPLHVVYMPGASTATTGITEKATPNAPWIMFPGTPKAHLMFTPSM